jgi:hypothetical protein
MDVDLQRGDTMINPKFRTAEGRIRAHDLVVANPMWNQPFAQEIFAKDPFDRFRTAGGITTGRGDWAWLQHTLACMNDQGRAAVVLDTGAVTRGSGSQNEDKERNIRKWFVEQDLIEGVVLLPDNLFYNTTGAGIIVVLNKRKPKVRKGRIVLLNASRHFKKGRPKNYLPEEDLRRLAEMFNKAQPVEGELTVISKEDAEREDYNLIPNKWVGTTSMVDIEDIGGVLAELRSLRAEEERITTRLLNMLGPAASRNAAQPSSAAGPRRTVGECLDTLRFAGLSKVQTRDYQKEGRFPVVDQGQSDIAGWTDDESAVITDPLPVVVFGDHTRALKFVDFPFARGADGTQVLRPRDGIDTRFFYYACRAINVPARGYNRHFTLLKEQEIPVPDDTDEQVQIAEVLHSVELALERNQRKGAALENLFLSLLHKLMSGEIRVADLDLSAQPAEASVDRGEAEP